MVASEYYSFLLRLWRVTENGNQEWRASLESVESGEKHGFTSLEELWIYLNQQTVTGNNSLGGERASEEQG
jgi:hypothetical protein